LPFSSPGGGSPAARPPAAPAWAAQPRIDRVVGPLELTAPTQLFLGRLTARRSPTLALAPLRHDVTLEAPKGIATGIARVRTTAAERPALESRWQRTRRRLRPPNLFRFAARDDGAVEVEGTDGLAEVAEPETSVVLPTVAAPVGTAHESTAAVVEPPPEIVVDAPRESAPPPLAAESDEAADSPAKAAAARADREAAGETATAPPARLRALRTLDAAGVPAAVARSLLEAPELPLVRPSSAPDPPTPPPAVELTRAGDHVVESPVGQERPRVVRRVGLGAPLQPSDLAPAGPPTPAVVSRRAAVVQPAATSAAPDPVPPRRGAPAGAEPPVSREAEAARAEPPASRDAPPPPSFPAEASPAPVETEVVDAAAEDTRPIAAAAPPLARAAAGDARMAAAESHPAVTDAPVTARELPLAGVAAPGVRVDVAEAPPATVERAPGLRPLPDDATARPEPDAARPESTAASSVARREATAVRAVLKAAAPAPVQRGRSAPLVAARSIARMEHVSPGVRRAEAHATRPDAGPRFASAGDFVAPALDLGAETRHDDGPGRAVDVPPPLPRFDGPERPPATLAAPQPLQRTVGSGGAVEGASAGTGQPIARLPTTVHAASYGPATPAASEPTVVPVARRLTATPAPARAVGFAAAAHPVRADLPLPPQWENATPGSQDAELKLANPAVARSLMNANDGIPLLTQLEARPGASPSPTTVLPTSTPSPSPSEPATDATAAAPTAPTAAAGGGHDDDEALANRLYDRIRRRLRSELLLDRERSGLLTE
jgi:hypothetical protein